MVDIQVRVLHRPSLPDLPQIYKELGTDYAERVLPSIVNEVLKSVVAQFNASSVSFLLPLHFLLVGLILFCLVSKGNWLLNVKWSLDLLKTT